MRLLLVMPTGLHVGYDEYFSSSPLGIETLAAHACAYADVALADMRGKGHDVEAHAEELLADSPDKRDMDALLYRACLKAYLSRHFLGSLFSRRTNLHRLRRTALRVFSSWIWFLLKERVASLLRGVFGQKVGRIKRHTKRPTGGP